MLPFLDNTSNAEKKKGVEELKREQWEAWRAKRL
jgi:hypothetical protein